METFQPKKQKIKIIKQLQLKIFPSNPMLVSFKNVLMEFTFTFSLSHRPHKHWHWLVYYLTSLLFNFNDISVVSWGN